MSKQKKIKKKKTASTTEIPFNTKGEFVVCLKENLVFIIYKWKYVKVSFIE